LWAKLLLYEDKKKYPTIIIFFQIFIFSDKVFGGFCPVILPKNGHLKSSK